MTLGKNFRLQPDTKPRTYEAELRLDLGADRFIGEIAIGLRLGAPRREIALHGVGLEVTDAGATVTDGPLRAATATTDAISETITLTFAEALPAGDVQLRIAYRGAFSPGLRGLYRAGALAVTQFEAADARRLFPCFDEPAFKATWRVAVSGVPADAVAISNGVVVSDEADGRGARRVTFATTPPLSSYLIALVVGPLVGSPTAAVREVPVRTWTMPEKSHLAAFAQETAAAVLPRLEDYFGLPYPFGKLDQIGVPDFEAGAMENAGAVTFREVALLADPATAPLAVQKRVAEVITHELAHQWFGNLVTMEWWDDLWLNEAFATWMAYKIVDDWRPAWRIWMDFEGGKGAALALDALVSAHPIRAEVRNAEEAGESFDAITYEKGGAVLRMLEGFLGADKFRDGIRLYMRRHRESNATADDLWGALAEASGQPIVDMANGWIRQTGYPVIDLSLEGDGRTVRLKQRRFFAEPGAEARVPGAANTRWLVPIVLRFRDEGGVKEQPVLLRDGEARVTLDGARRRRLVHRQRRRARVLPDRVRRRDARSPAPGGRRAGPRRAGGADLRRLGPGPGRSRADRALPGAGREPARRGGPRRARRAGRAAGPDRAPLPGRGGPRPLRRVRGAAVRRARRGARLVDGRGGRGRRDPPPAVGVAAGAGDPGP